MSDDLVPVDQELVPQPENTNPIPQQQERVISGRLEVSQYSGPLPDPEILARYEKVLPGAAERTFRLVESEQEHRHRMQEKQLDAEIADQKIVRNIEKRGPILALVVAAIVMGVSVTTALNGKEATASVIGGGGLIALVTAFIQGRKPQKDSDS
jgi:uncharacterized membrane protein